MNYDIIVLTEDRYWKPAKSNQYITNLLKEDQFLLDALRGIGLRCERLPWSHPTFDWKQTRSIIFRTTWDYFDRFSQFSYWLEKVKTQTILINDYELIKWNIDKHYLIELQTWDIAIPPTQFIEKDDKRSLRYWYEKLRWDPFILKPAVSGAGRHTYKLTADSLNEKEDLFQKLIQNESMLIQDYIPSVVEKGEVSFIIIGGQYTHAILKKAKAGDFRVQDDFGGTVHSYEPKIDEIKWAEGIFEKLNPMPAYGRVDAIWDRKGNLCVSELELIEPELWFRFHPDAAPILAKKCAERL